MRFFGHIIAAAVIAGTFGFGAPATASSMVFAAAPTKPVRDYDVPAIGGTIEDSFLVQETHGSFAAAQVFVRNAGLSRNLSLLLLEDMKANADVDAAIDRFGMDIVQLSVIQAIKTAQKSHDAAWTDVLANVYGDHFTPQELASLMREKEHSPSFDRLLELQQAIGSRILSEGEAVLSHARAEVLGTLATQLFQ